MPKPDLQYIRKELGVPELLAQLAEECDELGHAALKLRRVYDGTNPTPIHPDTALENLLEEIGDIQNCLRALNIDSEANRAYIDRSMKKKLSRWAWRLKNKDRKDER